MIIPAQTSVLVNAKAHRISGLCVSASILFVVGVLLAIARDNLQVVFAQNNCRTFTETGKTVCGRFLEYWSQNGGLRQQGFPISELMQEKSLVDGNIYTVQYFERAVFELHPENQPPYDVLLSLLGSLEYKKRWGKPYWPVQTPGTNNPLYFSQTGKTVGGAFREYWEQNGGLAQQGYPISNEFVERNPVDDKLYTVQYFERAVFELHPENQPPFAVLLSLLGRYQYDARYNVIVKPTQAASLPDCTEALRRRGTPIARGTNTIPTGRAKLKTYIVEEVVLPGRLNCPALVPSQADRYWRVIVTASDALLNNVGGNILGIWLDESFLGSAGVIEDGYTTRVFDLKLLQSGGTLSLGFSGGPKESLPEKLQFNNQP